MRRWNISSGMKDEKATFSMRVTELPWWVVLVEKITEAFTTVTRHVMCCNIPEWASKVPVGLKPKYDTDGFMENSLGWYWYLLGSRLNSPFWQHERTILDLPITYEQARTVDQEFADDMNGLWEDEDVTA